MSFAFAASHYADAQRFERLRDLQQSDPYFAKLFDAYRKFTNQLDQTKHAVGEADRIALVELQKIRAVLHQQLIDLIAEG